MPRVARIFLIAAALSAALVVALGAFGAHALRGKLEPRMLEVFQTGVQYQVFHSLGLAVVGLTALKLAPSRALRWSGWLMLAGMVLFSGSLYLLAVTGVRWLGAITPLGGIAFIAAWILFALAVARAEA
jgi:uncharacterized membrane protein YgdD (TMEM256/DUF423 family)